MGIDWIIFDVGGVLVRLGGMSLMHAWTDDQYTDEQIWDLWQHSSYVQAYETGQIDADWFARGMVADLQLPVTPEEFIDAFEHMPECVFDGVHDLLATLRLTYKVALLSNTNALHWTRIMGDMALGEHVDMTFASHEIGLMKPQPEIYSHVSNNLGVEPSAILFLDDLPANVTAAQQAGWHSIHVAGFHDVLEALRAKSLLSQSYHPQHGR